MVGPLVYLFVWITAAGQGTIGTFARNDFIVYYLTLIVVNQFTYPVSNWTIGDGIRYGTFSAWMLRPVAPIYEAIATDIATKMVCMPFVAGMVLLLAMVLRPTLTFSHIHISAGLLALVFAQVLRFMAAYVLALLTFWSNRTDALMQLNDSLLFLLAGQVAPTALLPGFLRNVAHVLPYWYMLGFPIEVLTGHLNQTEVLIGFGWQIIWIAMILATHHIVWQRGIRHYAAIGG
jgi:ABC-2 type transport system permease protein